MTNTSEHNHSKAELIEQSALEFMKLNEENKMFILGYMMGIQQEHQKGAGVKYEQG